MAYIPNDPEQRPVVAALATLTGLGVICTALRLYAIQQRAAKLIHWDFFWIVLSLVFALASEGPLLVALHNGLGRHLSGLTFSQITNIVEYELIAISLGLTSALFAKFAIIALFLDIQGPLVVYRRYFMHALAGILALSWASIIIITWFQCTPIQKTWQVLLPGNCNGQRYSNALSFLNGGLNVAADIFLSLYPISIIWGLKLKMRTKVAWCLLMAGGLLATAACIVRTVMIEIVWKNVEDITYVVGRFMLWGLLEMWLVIILGSLPVLRPLMLRWLGAKDRNDNQGIVPLAHWTATDPLASGNPTTGNTVGGKEDDATFRTLSMLEKEAGLGSFTQVVVTDRNDSRLTNF
ncbi:hypothetical protein K461DRAFT_290948 [Myriangium duriaei CBS 260.36]|uniref:Rhodopsin domain-containing protein n=1 Tax=Myriangium duriaei CBS 260.36 TaxID=1168546 RepID=A0A9P4J6V6_9PEZI|nr:hypothetical protein K461DRAFT_290948 [Myriangium duriaei CBS 260.36]